MSETSSDNNLRNSGLLSPNSSNYVSKSFSKIQYTTTPSNNNSSPITKKEEEPEQIQAQELITKGKQHARSLSSSTKVSKRVSEDLAKAAKSLMSATPLSKSLGSPSHSLNSKCQHDNFNNINSEISYSTDSKTRKPMSLLSRKKSTASDNKIKGKRKLSLSSGSMFTNLRNIYDDHAGSRSASNNKYMDYLDDQNNEIRHFDEFDNEEEEDHQDDIGKLKMGKSVISLLTTTSIYSEFNKLGLNNHHNSNHHNNFLIEDKDNRDKNNGSGDSSSDSESESGGDDEEDGTNKTEQTNFFDQLNTQGSEGNHDESNIKDTNVFNNTSTTNNGTSVNRNEKEDLSQKSTLSSLKKDIASPFFESVIKSLQSKRELIFNSLNSSTKTVTNSTSSPNKGLSEDEDYGLTEKRAIALTEKMVKVFQVDVENDVLIDDFSCWLLRDVLLQGHLYITKQYLLFFAYLPSKKSNKKNYSKCNKKSKKKINSDDSDVENANDNKIIMKGNLTVSKGKKNVVAAAVASKFESSHLVQNRRYWCVLRYSSFSVYNNSTDLYFPVHNIDLKTISKVDVLYEDNSKKDNDDEDKGNIESNSSSTGYFTKLSSPFLSKDDKASMMLSSSSASSDNTKICNLDSSSPTRKSSSSPKRMSSDTITPNNDSSQLDQPGTTTTCESLAIIDQIKERNMRTRSRSGSIIKDDADNATINSIIKPHKFKIITTDNRSFIFICDSLTSATNWVSHIKTQLFTLKNKSDEIIIKLPISNIFDLEINLIFENAHNIRLKVLEDSSSYALDDYFFLFFNSNSSISGKNNCHDFVNSIYKAAASNENSLLLDKDLFTKRNSISGMQKPKRRGSSSTITDTYIPSTETIKETQKILLQKDSDDNKNYEDEKGDVSKSGKSYVYDYGTKALNVFNPKNLVKNVITQRIQNGIEMWSSNPIHYEKVKSSSININGTDSDDVEDKFYEDSESERTGSVERFRNYFSLPKTEKLIASYFAYLQRNIPLYGKIYVGNSKICFRSLLPGSNTKMILPFADVENCYNEKNFSFGYSGLVLVINGHEELFFEFSTNESRDDCGYLILKQLDFSKSTSSSIDNSHNSSSNNSSYENCSRSMMLSSSYSSTSLNTFSQVADLKKNEDKINRVQDGNSQVPIIIKDLTFSKPDSLKPARSYKFVCLTIGSRGDVQPYVALCKQLIKEGHSATIATHGEFKEFVESRGIKFKEIAGSPTELMAFMGNYSTISVSFIKDAKAKFSKWIDELLATSWVACLESDVDILIESPSAMAGIHIAEALNIPYFEAFTMPWTRTRAYPHAFIVPESKKGGSYNYFTHVMFENVFWKGISHQVNNWRVKTLGLPKTDLYYLQRNKVPFLYNISPTVFPPSVDFADWISVTGYWFLDEKQNYKPPQDLVRFIDKAKKDKKKIVYIGFGSIVVSDPMQLTEAIIQAVLKADVRCILNKGWSGRLESVDNKELEVELPTTGEIYNSGSLPHDWLFTQIDVAVHHGGSGTTGASLRAGLPTIVKPFFGDQFFYAHRIEDMNVGVYLRKLNPDSLAKAIKKCCIDQRIIEKAKSIGEKIRAEKGVQNAIKEIYSQLDYAQSIISVKREQSMKRLNSGGYFKHSKTNKSETRHQPLLSGIPGIKLEQPAESDISSSNIVVSGNLEEALDKKDESLADKLHSISRKSSLSIKKTLPLPAPKSPNGESWVLL